MIKILKKSHVVQLLLIIVLAVLVFMITANVLDIYREQPDNRQTNGNYSGHTTQPKLTTEESLQKLTVLYEQASDKLESLEQSREMILAIYEEEKGAIVCSDTNRFFNSLADEYEEYGKRLDELASILVEFDQEYAKYVEALNAIPNYAVLRKANAQSELRKTIEPMQEAFLMIKQSKDSDKEDLEAVYIAAKKLADDLYDEYIVWMPGLTNAEGGNTPVEEQCYIMKVVENRIKSPRFPNNLYAVLHAPRQYSTVGSGAIYKPVPKSVRQNVEKYLRGEIRTDMPEDVLYQALFIQGPIWKHMPSGHYFCK